MHWLCHVADETFSQTRHIKPRKPIIDVSSDSNVDVAVAVSYASSPNVNINTDWACALQVCTGFRFLKTINMAYLILNQKALYKKFCLPLSSRPPVFSSKVCCLESILIG